MFNDISPTSENPKVCLYMEAGYGYSTRLGVHFTKDHPFQIVNAEEFNELYSTGRFRIATHEEVREFYNI